MEVDAVHLCGLPGGLSETSWSVLGTRKEPPGVFVGASRIDDGTILLSRQSDGASSFSVSSRTRLRAWPLGPPSHRFAAPCVSDRCSRRNYALLQPSDRPTLDPASADPATGARDAQVVASWPFNASSVAPSALLHKTGDADGCHVADADRPIHCLFPLSAKHYADETGKTTSDQATPGASATASADASAHPSSPHPSLAAPASPLSLSGGVLGLCTDGSIRTYSPDLSLTLSLTEPADGLEVRVEAAGSGSWVGYKGEGKGGSEWVLAVVVVEGSEGESEAGEGKKSSSRNDAASTVQEKGKATAAGKGASATPAAAAASSSSRGERAIRLYHVVSGSAAGGDSSGVGPMAIGGEQEGVTETKVTLLKSFGVRNPGHKTEAGGTAEDDTVVSLCVGDAGDITLLWSDATWQCFHSAVPPYSPSPKPFKDAVTPPAFLEPSLTRRLAVPATQVVTSDGANHQSAAQKPATLKPAARLLTSRGRRVAAAAMAAVPETRYCVVIAAKPPVTHTAATSKGAAAAVPAPASPSTGEAPSSQLPLYAIVLDTLFGCVHACTPLPSSCSLPSSLPPSPLPLPLLHTEWVGPSPDNTSLLVTTPTAVHAVYVHCPPLSLASVLGALQPAVPVLLPSEPAAEPVSGSGKVGTVKIGGVAAAAAGVATAGWGGLAASAARAAGLALADGGWPGGSNPLQSSGCFVGPTLEDSRLVENLPGSILGVETEGEEEDGKASGGGFLGGRGGSKAEQKQPKWSEQKRKKGRGNARGKSRFGRVQPVLSLSRAVGGDGRQWLSFVNGEAERELLRALEGGEEEGSGGAEEGEEREEGEDMEEGEEAGMEEDDEEEEDEEEVGEEGKEGEYWTAVDEADGIAQGKDTGGNSEKERDPTVQQQLKLAHLILNCAKRLHKQSGQTSLGQPSKAAAAAAAAGMSGIGVVAEADPSHHQLTAEVSDSVRLFSPSLVSALTQHAMARSHRMLLRAVICSGQVTSALAPNLVPSLVVRKEALLLESCVVHVADLPPKHLALILRLLLDAAVAEGERGGESEERGGMMGEKGDFSRVGSLRRLRGRSAIGEVKSVLAGMAQGDKESSQRFHTEFQSLLAAALTSAAELDVFTDAELSLHTVVAVPFDDTVLAAALAPLSLPHVHFLLSYFAKWVDVYSARGFSAGLPAYCVNESRPFLPVPSLERIFAWVSTLIDCHITRLLMLPDCLEPIARLHRRIMEQAAIGQRLTSVIGFVPHILAGLPLPEKQQNGYGGHSNVGAVDQSALTVQVVEL